MVLQKDFWRICGKFEISVVKYGLRGIKKCIFAFLGIFGAPYILNEVFHRGLFNIKWLRIIFGVGENVFTGFEMHNLRIIGSSIPLRGKMPKSGKMSFFDIFLPLLVYVVSFLVCSDYFETCFSKFDIFQKMTNFWTPFWSILVVFCHFC